MPDSLAGRHGKYLVVPNVRFASDTRRCWRRWGATRSTRCTDGSMVRRRRELQRSQAISYRFKRDAKGWRVFATTELPEVEVTTAGGVERSGWT